MLARGKTLGNENRIEDPALVGNEGDAGVLSMCMRSNPPVAENVGKAEVPDDLGRKSQEAPPRRTRPSRKARAEMEVEDRLCGSVAHPTRTKAVCRAVNENR